MLQLTCPACHDAAPGREQCPQCGNFLVVEDPHPPYIPCSSVGDPVASVWEASLEAANGLCPATCILGPVRAVEDRMRWALGQPSLPFSVRSWMESAVVCLQDIRGFVDSLRVADLNAAWLELGPVMEGLRDALEDEGVAMTSSSQAHRYHVSSFFTQDRVEFTDLDE
jgi:hypothetical protein